ncbi:hypothetical protein T439DRAFT_359943 [Meredithblackwellia eburnea MCA 4105]
MSVASLLKPVKQLLRRPSQSFIDQHQPQPPSPPETISSITAPSRSTSPLRPPDLTLRLPLEILDIVMEYLVLNSVSARERGLQQFPSRRGDLTHAAACCRRWSGPARRAIFLHVKLIAGSEYGRTDTAKYLAQHPWREKFVPNSLALVGGPGQTREVLDACREVRCLELALWPLGREDLDSSTSPKTDSFTQLRTLRLFNVESCVTLFRYIPTPTTLVDLTLSWSYQDSPASPFILRDLFLSSRASLRRLHLKLSTASCLYLINTFPIISPTLTHISFLQPYIPDLLLPLLGECTSLRTLQFAQFSLNRDGRELLKAPEFSGIDQVIRALPHRDEDHDCLATLETLIFTDSRPVGFEGRDGGAGMMEAFKGALGAKQCAGLRRIHFRGRMPEIAVDENWLAVVCAERGVQLTSDREFAPRDIAVV